MTYVATLVCKQGPTRGLRDESLEDSANLPDPDVLAAEIAEDLRAALGQIEGVLEDLEGAGA